MKKIIYVFAALSFFISSGISSFAMSRTEQNVYDPMIQLEASESNSSYYETLKEREIDRRVNEFVISNNMNGVGTNNLSNDGRYVSANVKLIKQTTSYNCGPTAALQVLYGSNSQGRVNGANDSAKISRLMSDSGTNSDGTIVYKLKNALNLYSSLSYTYTAGRNMTFNTFREKVNNSLFYNTAPILHARTEKIPYYNGHKSGHYIAVSQLDLTRNIVRLQDCNYYSQYYGTHDANMSDIYNSITPDSRYLIHLNY